MTNILLTGFEPFGEFIKNCSYDAIKVFNNRTINNFTFVVKKLPVSYKKAGKILEKYIKEYKPKIVIAFGMGKEVITFESIALNINYTTRLDNDGVKIESELPVVSREPIAYKTNLPFGKISQALKKRNIPFRNSFHAGTYLCNNIFYHLMHYSKKYKIQMSGFFHLPPTKECVTKKYKGKLIKMKTLQKAVRLIVGEYVKQQS